MGKLQAITNSLIEINGAIFQELCDSFLVKRVKDYSSFNRLGSQSIKQKTTIGTPDSFFLLSNGKYMFAEYTTVSSNRLNKLKNDICDCLNPLKTSIPKNKIEKIILCFNFNLKASEIEELKDLINESDITLDLFNLDSLAMELFLNHKTLVNEYLGLPVDTGQIVSLEQFIDEYNRASKGIATPLDNKFLHREEELKILKKLLNKSDFIILTGKPGVGKTKLAIEGIKDYLKENEGYNAYCVSYKNYDLFNDLYLNFDMDKDYIIFVDDANRIDSFEQITGFYKAKRKGILKVVITVRDYAYKKVKEICQDFNPSEINIKKLRDEDIIDIIKSDPFNILNQNYHKEIIRIADGNPRLAIMVSKLAIEKQNISALSDVSELFEKYFSTFIKDDGQFSNKINLKCLGLIAFFYVLPYRDKDIISSVLNIFDISYSEFIDSIDELERLELVELQFDNVKISEQNISTYFFYKTFIKDDILSFKDLLMNFFDNRTDRFIDCVIPANNTFGPKNVMEKIMPELQSYWQDIKNNDEKAYVFLNTFWYYLQDEVVEFVYNKIQKLSKPESADYKTDYNKNDFAYNKNQIIELLSNLYIFNNNLKTVLELSFKYAKRKPEHLAELIYRIRERLTFDNKDKRINFERQEILFDLIIKKLNNDDEIYVESFYELSKTFLDYTFDQTEGGKNNKFYFYSYPIPNNSYIQKIRANIWDAIYVKFNDYPEKSLGVLKSYAEVKPEVTKTIMEFDLTFILSIINQYLSEWSFEHCYLVQKLIYLFEKNEVFHSSLNELRGKFTNYTYDVYMGLNWSRHRRREVYEYESYQDFMKLKEEDIRRKFVFNSIKGFKKFFNAFEYVINSNVNTRRHNSTLDIIIDENFLIDYKLGVQILEFLISQGNSVHYNPRIVFKNQLEKRDRVNEIWNLIEDNSFNNYIKWRLLFHYNLDNEFINKSEIDKVINTINKIQDNTFIRIEKLEKYILVESNFFNEIFEIIAEKNKENNYFINYRIEFFSDKFDLIGDDINLIKRLYLQQNKLNSTIDNEGNLLLEILKIDKNFICEYLEDIILENEYEYVNYEDHKKLSIIWSINKIEDTINKAFDLVIEKQEFLGMNKSFCNAFFANLDKDELENNADDFIMDYIRKFNANVEKMNIIFDVIRNSREHLFENALRLFVSLNSDAEFFSRVEFIDRSGAYTGDVIIGEIIASKWEEILMILKNIDIGIEFIPIRDYIKSQIRKNLNWAKSERKRKFLNKY